MNITTFYKPGRQAKPMAQLETNRDAGKVSLEAADTFVPAGEIEKTTASVGEVSKTAPTVDIEAVQSDLAEQLSHLRVEFLHTDSFDNINGRLATEAELTSMIESFKDESGIPFGYIKDGCYARAHLMDESFRQHDINFAKMFVRGDLSAENEHMEARWWYHVAPLTFVDDGEGNPDPRIIDPGFSDKPLTLKQWVEAMNQGPSIQVDLVDPEQYYPRRYNKPDTFSESLPPAVSRMQSYAKKFHRIRESAGQDVGDFVTPTWDEPGSGGDFLVDGERKTVFPQGVKSTETEVYFSREGDDRPTVLIFQPLMPEPEISAAWENRPDDFDPYR